MPIPSAIDLLKKQIPYADELAGRALDKLISRHEPKGVDRNAQTVEEALQRIQGALDMGQKCLRGLLSGSVQLKITPPLNQIEGQKEDVQHALDLLEGTFGTEIGTGSTAETLVVQIAHNYAKFRAQMTAMRAAVEKIGAHAVTEKPAPPVKVVKKPAPKPEGKAAKPGPRPAAGQSAPQVQITVNPAPKPEKKDAGAAVIPLHDTPSDTEPAATEGEGDDADELFRSIVEEQDAPKKPGPVDTSKPQR